MAALRNIVRNEASSTFKFHPCPLRIQCAAEVSEIHQASN